MKKTLIASVAFLSAAAAFAGDSDQLKAIVKEKDFNQAETLVKQSVEQLANPAEKAKAYNHLVDLAMDKFNAEQAIETANVAATQLGQGTATPYDTVGFYNAAYNALVYAIECDKYDQMPNEKGKVKPKYREGNATRVSNARVQLVNAGQDAAQTQDYKGALKYWGTFLDTDNAELLAAVDKSSEAAYIGQVAYYAALFANELGDYARAEKYCDIAMNDPEQKKEATNLKFSVAQRNLKTQADSLAYIGKLKEYYAQDPSSDAAFGTLCTMYSNMNMKDDLAALVADKISKDPGNATAWMIKGLTEMQDEKWEEAAESLKKSNDIDGTNPVVLTNLGASINNKAAKIENDIPAQKALYKESMTYLERAKELDPGRERANWAYYLYQCYYVNYSANDPKTKELEGLLNK